MSSDRLVGDHGAMTRNRTSTVSGVRSRRPIRVIVADDQEFVRRGLEILLEALGEIEVVARAADGASAVRQAGALEPDLVVMDCRMPILDGLEATRLLKGRSPGISILALSMYPDLRNAALAAGADAFVLKGGPGSELVDTIYRVLADTHRQRVRSTKEGEPCPREARPGES